MRRSGEERSGEERRCGRKEVVGRRRGGSQEVSLTDYRSDYEMSHTHGGKGAEAQEVMSQERRLLIGQKIPGQLL